MDERDLRGRDTRLDELRTDIVINVESFRIGRRKVAEDELSASARFCVAFQIADDASNGAINLRLDLGLVRPDRSTAYPARPFALRR